MSLRELYQEIIIDHAREPRNAGTLSEANHSHSGFNPLCGDKIKVYVLAEKAVIKDIRFQAEGCAISIASASLMSEALKGQSLLQAEKLFTHFHELLTGQSKGDETLGKLAVFSSVAEFPIRVKCATLAWHTLKAALNNDSNLSSTE